MSLPPDVEYHWNPFNEVYLMLKFDVSTFSMTGDFQTGLFADFKQFRINGYFSDFGQVKIDHSFIFSYFGELSYATDLQQNIRLQKTTLTLPDKKFKNFA